MSYLLYPALAEWDPDAKAWSILFPDFPEVCSFTRQQGDIAREAADALLTAIDVRREDGKDLPDPTRDLAEHTKGWPSGTENMVVHVAAPGDLPDTEPVRVNISVDKRLLQRIDGAATTRGMTRSAFLSEGARMMLRG